MNRERYTEGLKDEAVKRVTERSHPFDEAAVWRSAVELFEGDQAAAERWLYQGVRGLGGKRPIDVMQADPAQVLNLIGRLEHGVWS